MTSREGGMPNLRRIPTVLSADELVEKAFHKAARISIFSHDPFEKSRATEIARLRSVENTLDAALSRYVKSFPSFENLPSFYRELARAVVDVDRARKALGAVDWVRNRILSVADESVGKMRRSHSTSVIGEERKRAYGRIASLLADVAPDLDVLNGVRDKLKELPTIEAENPTIVVAGYPNVGKSSFVRAVSSAAPEVAPYPFTTKGIVVGHFESHRVRYQIIDTPGLLDRPVEERNPIERQAIAALHHLGDAVVFLIDPTELCGYPVAAQERLLAEVGALFPERPLIVAEAKADVAPEARAGPSAVPRSDPDRHSISTVTGTGVEELRNLAAGRALEEWKRRMAARAEEEAAEAALAQMHRD